MFGRSKEAVAPLAGEQIMRQPLNHIAGTVLELDHPCDCGQTTIGACSQMDARHCGDHDEEEAPEAVDALGEAPEVADTVAAVPGPLGGPDWIQTIVEARDVLNAAERLGLIKLQVGEAFVGQLEVFKLTPKVVHTVEEELLP